MKFVRVFISLFLLIGLMPTLIVAQQGEKLPPINVTEYRLKNGLSVVLHQDKSTPIVAVNAFYHVGSKNEAPGRTGLPTFLSTAAV